jgi:hypothetical protein
VTTRACQTQCFFKAHCCFDSRQLYLPSRYRTREQSYPGRSIGRVALIASGGSGIGHASALRLAKRCRKGERDPADRKVQVGVVGCGAVAAAYYLPCLMDMDRVDLVAVCDLYETRISEASLVRGVGICTSYCWAFRKA